MKCKERKKPARVQEQLDDVLCIGHFFFFPQPVLSTCFDETSSSCARTSSPICTAAVAIRQFAAPTRNTMTRSHVNIPLGRFGTAAVTAAAVQQRASKLVYIYVYVPLRYMHSTHIHVHPVCVSVCTNDHSLAPTAIIQQQQKTDEWLKTMPYKCIRVYVGAAATPLHGALAAAAAAATHIAVEFCKHSCVGGTTCGGSAGTTTTRSHERSIGLARSVARSLLPLHTLYEHRCDRARYRSPIIYIYMYTALQGARASVYVYPGPIELTVYIIYASPEAAAAVAAIVRVGDCQSVTRCSARRQLSLRTELQTRETSKKCTAALPDPPGLACVVYNCPARPESLVCPARLRSYTISYYILHMLLNQCCPPTAPRIHKFFGLLYTFFEYHRCGLLFSTAARTFCPCTPLHIILCVLYGCRALGTSRVFDVYTHTHINDQPLFDDIRVYTFRHTESCRYIRRREKKIEGNIKKGTEKQQQQLVSIQSIYRT
ncbi:unnamed protein product [Trichogramma brassicae]|uniref:Uncharacterized protein n=1 Tax=Trichogramma brassicae TaxID=86971 RepID=A0A6H5I4L5_9HYME|nr:unnamed protein product [Trichogramma brassicae]